MQHQRSKSMCHRAWGAGEERVRITHGPVTACEWWCHHREGRMRGVNPFPSHLSLNGHQKEVVRPQSMENDFPSNTSWQEMMTEFAVGYCHKKRTQDEREGTWSILTLFYISQVWCSYVLEQGNSRSTMKNHGGFLKRLPCGNPIKLFFPPF